MKTVMRARHYCEFCKKSGGSSYHMLRHEAVCTANPKRGCRMCGAPTRFDELTHFVLAGDVGGLREAAEGCPACMLAAIRQAPYPLTSHAVSEHDDITYQDRPDAIRNWNFKDESKAWWEAANQEKRENH